MPFLFTTRGSSLWVNVLYRSQTHMKNIFTWHHHSLWYVTVCRLCPEVVLGALEDITVYFIFSNTKRPVTPTKTFLLKDYWSKQGSRWTVYGQTLNYPSVDLCLHVGESQNKILDDCRWMLVSCISCKPPEVNPLHHSLHGMIQHSVAMTPHQPCLLIGWLRAWMLPLQSCLPCCVVLCGWNKVNIGILWHHVHSSGFKYLKILRKWIKWMFALGKQVFSVITCILKHL